MILHYLPTYVGITETELLLGAASPVSLRQYCSLVNPAVKRLGSTIIGKWGVQMLIRKDVALNGAPVKLPAILNGRACFQDVWMTSANAAPELHRLGVVYGISGQTNIETVEFWAEITKIIKSGPPQWSITGDANVSLSSAEITASQHIETHASRSYRKFLTLCQGLDAWELHPDRSLKSWTYQKGGIRTIIDRSAASTLPGLFEVGVVDAREEGKYKYPKILNTDHRPILTTILLPGLVDTSQSALPENARPRIIFTDDTLKTGRYTTMCKEEFHKAAAVADWPSDQINDDATFSETYRRFSEIMIPACEKVFDLAAKVRTEKKPITFSHKTEKLGKDGANLSRMIGAAQQGTLGEMMHSGRHTWTWALYYEALDLPHEGLMEQMVQLRKLKGKLSYAAKKAEIHARAAERRIKDLQAILAGQSASKVLGHEESTCLQPRVLQDPDDPTKILTSKEDIHNATRRAFNARFTHDPIPRAQEDKFWMKSKKSQEFRAGSLKDPMIWPPTEGVSLADIDGFLDRGNNRPSPGPDGWEKWPIKYLPEEMLEILRLLVDYITRTNYFGDGLNDLLFLTLWKNKGTMINLNYFRGIGLGNLLHQMAVTVFTTTFKKYCWRRGFLPPTQGAANAGLQGRDLTSYIAQIDAWAHANETTLYWIKRDQMKGYDRVIPEAFDDACEFFGLPDSVRDFVRASKRGLKAYAVTAFGVDLEAIIMEMIMRQGGPFSPNEFTLVFAMASHWVHEEMEERDPVYIQTSNGRNKCPHGEIDQKKIRVHMPEQMDDSCNIRSSLAMMAESTKLFEDFGRTYGSQTDFADASKTEIGILGKDPGPLPDKIDVVTEYGTFAVPVSRRAPVFLRTPINNPEERMKECLKIVESAFLPRLHGSMPMPLALLLTEVERRLITRIEARLALQPIKPADAAILDTKIVQRIKAYYGWTFSPIAEFLNLKLKHQGLELPSIQDRNAAVAVRGLVRDLNHHIPHLREMAEISFAQWRCRKSGCLDPLHPSQRTQNKILRNTIPSHWEIAQQCLPEGIVLVDTEQVSVRNGQVALRHLLARSESQMTVNEHTNTQQAISFLEEVGIAWLADLGKWQGDVLVLHQQIPWPHELRPTMRRYESFIQWITSIGHISSCTDDVRFTYSLEDQGLRLRSEIDDIIIQSPHRARESDTDWASDGSMIKGKDYSSVTAAAIGTRSVTAKLPNPLANSLHGEVAGLILALADFQTVTSEVSNAVTHTDYLNAIGKLKGSLSYPFPGVHYYRLYRELEDAQAQQSALTLQHVKSHTAVLTLPERMNDECDKLAKAAHGDPLVAIMPEPVHLLPRGKQEQKPTSNGE
ncbi:hypothetical protein P7C70_g5424, partial [Phenoliferia sp. Uapishka_3]